MYILKEGSKCVLEVQKKSDQFEDEHEGKGAHSAGTRRIATYRSISTASRSCRRALIAPANVPFDVTSSIVLELGLVPAPIRCRALLLILQQLK